MFLLNCFTELLIQLGGHLKVVVVVLFHCIKLLQREVQLIRSHDICRGNGLNSHSEESAVSLESDVPTYSVLRQHLTCWFRPSAVIVVGACKIFRREIPFRVSVWIGFKESLTGQNVQKKKRQIETTKLNKPYTAGTQEELILMRRTADPGELLTT